ncbi:MAG: hypothetical protein ABI905_13550 [Betaproteobacteria bacterium]
MTLALAANAASAAEFTAKDLAAEEGKFAAYSVKHGMRDAFVEFFADDSVLLRPDPVEGRPFMRARTNPPIVLDWKSQITVLSASRDIGMSTGPSIVNAKGQPTSYGQFFSIWQKQKNGDWRVLLDHGISHGEKAAPDTPLDARDLPAGPVAASTGDDAEMRFAARTADAGVAIAYAEAVTDRTRLLRVDSVPIQGVAAINALAKNMEGKWTWETLKKGTSQAHDFLYVLGKYKRQTGAGPAQQGHFIRVWIQDTQSGVARWTLAGEVLTPRPAPKT